MPQLAQAQVQAPVQARYRYQYQYQYRVSQPPDVNFTNTFAPELQRAATTATTTLQARIESTLAAVGKCAEGEGEGSYVCPVRGGGFEVIEVASRELCRECRGEFLAAWREVRGQLGVSEVMGLRSLRSGGVVRFDGDSDDEKEEEEEEREWERVFGGNGTDLGEYVRAVDVLGIDFDGDGDGAGDGDGENETVGGGSEGVEDDGDDNDGTNATEEVLETSDPIAQIDKVEQVDRMQEVSELVRGVGGLGIP